MPSVADDGETERSCVAVLMPAESLSGLPGSDGRFGALEPGEQPTKQWIAGRLLPLSYLLRRPQPTAGGFAFPADEHFYARCEERRLQEAVDLVLAHVGLPRAAVGHVALDPTLDSGGRVTHAKSASYLQLSPYHAENRFEVGALVAHLCAHVVSQRAKLPVLGGWEDEINTDLIAVLCGLGPLLVASDAAATYLDQVNCRFAHAFVTRALGLESDLQQPVDLLRFGPPTETTWFRCPFCAHGMRVRGAAGRQCRVTCKACGNSVAFDGRLCRVDPMDDDQP